MTKEEAAINGHTYEKDPDPTCPSCHGSGMFYGVEHGDVNMGCGPCYCTDTDAEIKIKGHGLTKPRSKHKTDRGSQTFAKDTQ